MTPRFVRPVRSFLTLERHNCRSELAPSSRSSNIRAWAAKVGRCHQLQNEPYSWLGVRSCGLIGPDGCSVSALTIHEPFVGHGTFWCRRDSLLVWMESETSA